MTAGKGTGQFCYSTPTSPGTNDKAPEDTKAPETPEAKCVAAGQTYGTFNGVVVCTPASSSKETSNTVKTEKNAANQITSTTTTSETTTITNNNGVSTKTVIGVNPDGSTTTTQTTGATGKGAGDGTDIDLGEPTQAGDITEQEKGITTLTPVSVTSNMSCPQSVSLPHGWGTISYAPACSLAGMIRPLTLALAWLGAGLIVVGGLRNG